MWTSLQLIKVYGEDSHSRSLWVSPGATAREICHMLVQTAHCSDQENWALLELHPTLALGKTVKWTLTRSWGEIYRCEMNSLKAQTPHLVSSERCLEDHEVVLEVQATWSLKGDTRLIFCKNYAKYEFFRKPMVSLLKITALPSFFFFLTLVHAIRPHILVVRDLSDWQLACRADRLTQCLRYDITLAAVCRLCCWTEATVHTGNWFWCLQHVATLPPEGTAVNLIRDSSAVF